MSDLAPEDVVAAFDSATVLHGCVAALAGTSHPHLGNSALAGAAVRAAGRLPWPVLRRLYTRVGASEGVDVERLGGIDLDAVARMLADAVPARRYPGVLLGIEQRRHGAPGGGPADAMAARDGPRSGGPRGRP